MSNAIRAIDTVLLLSETRSTSWPGPVLWPCSGRPLAGRQHRRREARQTGSRASPQTRATTRRARSMGASEPIDWCVGGGDKPGRPANVSPCSHSRQTKPAANRPSGQVQSHPVQTEPSHVAKPLGSRWLALVWASRFQAGAEWAASL
jgi:hypothetical protein